MNITVTGAAGYIGSHACLRLLDDGHRVHGLDNYSRSFERTVQALRRAGAGRFHFTNVELTDHVATTAALQSHPPEIVMHFAAFAVVPESVKFPLLYWRNNVGATVSLLQAMDEVDAKNLYFPAPAPHMESPRQSTFQLAKSAHSGQRTRTVKANWRANT